MPREKSARAADTTAFEPEILEHKWYAPGVGFVQEHYITGGDEKVVLEKMTRP